MLSGVCIIHLVPNHSDFQTGFYTFALLFFAKLFVIRKQFSFAIPNYCLICYKKCLHLLQDVHEYCKYVQLYMLYCQQFYSMLQSQPFLQKRTAIRLHKKYCKLSKPQTKLFFFSLCNTVFDKSRLNKITSSCACFKAY